MGTCTCDADKHTDEALEAWRADRKELMLLSRLLGAKLPACPPQRRRGDQLYEGIRDRWTDCPCGDDRLSTACLAGAWATTCPLEPLPCGGQGAAKTPRGLNVPGLAWTRGDARLLPAPPLAPPPRPPLAGMSGNLPCSAWPPCGTSAASDGFVIAVCGVGAALTSDDPGEDVAFASEFAVCLRPSLGLLLNCGSGGTTRWVRLQRSAAAAATAADASAAFSITSFAAAMMPLPPPV